MTTKSTAEQRHYKPLVTPEQARLMTNASPWAKYELERDALITENAKLRELAQELVNDLRRLRMEFGNRTETTTQIGIASLESSKEQGFVPTNTTQDHG